MREEGATESRSLRESGTAWKTQPANELKDTCFMTATHYLIWDGLMRDFPWYIILENMFLNEGGLCDEFPTSRAAEEWTFVPWITWFSLIDIYKAPSVRASMQNCASRDFPWTTSTCLSSFQSLFNVTMLWNSTLHKASNSHMAA